MFFLLVLSNCRRRALTLTFSCEEVKREKCLLWEKYYVGAQVIVRFHALSFALADASSADALPMED